MAQKLHQPGLDLVGDDVLPPSRLEVGFLPGQADDVGQQPLGEPVLATTLSATDAARRGE